MKAPLPIDGPVRWGYAMNTWKPGFMGFARQEEHERAFKVTAACGFRAIELTAGSGRWEPLGRPDNIAANYGSLAGFRERLRQWGIQAVASVFYDPGQLSFEDLHFGLDPLRSEHHEPICVAARMHAEGLAHLGGHCLVVRPVGSFWQHGELDAGKLAQLALCWGRVSEQIAPLGIKLGLHVDALSALRTIGQMEALLARLDPAQAGLAIDTAEMAIAGHDVTALYRRLHRRVVHLHFKDALATDSLEEYRLHNAERALLQAGGSRGIRRWFSEMGTGHGIVDFPQLMRAIRELDYRGWIIVESDRGPPPIAAGIMSNGWFVQHVLAAAGAGSPAI
jgi:inosose dehydratase